MGSAMRRRTRARSASKNEYSGGRAHVGNPRAVPRRYEYRSRRTRAAIEFTADAAALPVTLCPCLADRFDNVPSDNLGRLDVLLAGAVADAGRNRQARRPDAPRVSPAPASRLRASAARPAIIGINLPQPRLHRRGADITTPGIRTHLAKVTIADPFHQT